ncbi:hypothetical protein [Streptomyces aureoverticillatus]|uniref:hypothetical protein n=1 Tax=Streptomyces aureoverticillatus TaxID=66871 RepID=UPI0013D9CCB7|nr:hypothetical protein [Streptomyces aureoverticillatus]QIB49560.1 hypothetical protein G3H79_41075 [Streptomyces aureoverticillatus]
MDWQGGDWATQARYHTGLAVLGGQALTGRQEELARAVLEVVLKTGLQPYSLEADAEGEATGLALEPRTGRADALRVIWQQDPPAEFHMPSEVWNAQQAAMNQALRAILSANGFWVQDGPSGEAPIVLGVVRPD